MGNSSSFIAELKRRNVYKVAVAYAVVGWLVMQVAATIVPALHLPDAITSAVVVVTLLGFPIALVLAWAFELTPEGIKRTEDVDPAESIRHHTGRKIVAITVALAAVALAATIMRLPHARVPRAAESVDQAPGIQIPAKSIAVLPFENRSDEKS